MRQSHVYQGGDVVVHMKAGNKVDLTAVLTVLGDMGLEDQCSGKSR